MIPDDIKEVINYVIKYVGTSTNDWFTIKKEILGNAAPKKRSLFSRRHYSTKKHILNDFDHEVIAYWQEKTGIKIHIDENKLHPKDWVQRPVGWGLKEYVNRKKSKNINRKSC